MGFFTRLGKSKWLKYTFLSFIGITFFLAQLGTGIVDYFTRSRKYIPDMAIIAGQKVDVKSYHKMLNITQQELIQEGYKREQVDYVAHFYTWQHFLDKHMYTPLHRAIGLVVLPEEEVTIFEEARDLSFLCSRPQPYVADIPQFQDKEGNFDRAKWMKTLRDMATTPIGKERIKSIEAIIGTRRMKQKLITVLQATVHVPKLEAAQYPGEKNVAISCLYVPYSSIASLENVTKGEKQNYLDKHAEKYETQEARDLEYVVVHYSASKEDEDLFKEELEELAMEFSKTSSPQNFAKKHTDGDQKTVCTWTKSNMPPLIAAQLNLLIKGKVVGPIQEGNLYSLYRIISHGGKKYSVAKLTKKITISEYTAHERLQEAEVFKQAKNLEEFKQLAKERGLRTYPYSITKEELERGLGTRGIFRRMQQWLFDPNTTTNSVSNPIDTDSKYIVCIMKGEIKKEKAPLSKVAYKIEASIRKDKAAKKIRKKLKKLAKKKKSLKNIAKEYGEGAKVHNFKIENFEQNELKSIGLAPKVIGSAFGLKEGERSTILLGQDGIFIIERIANTSKDFEGRMLISKRKVKLYNQQENDVLVDVYSKCLEESNVEDNRHVYFQ